MISIEEKLYITKEINDVLVRHAREVVLKKLLTSFSFENDPFNQGISELIQKLQHNHGLMPSPEDHLELIDFIDQFIKRLDNDEITALHFWVINEYYVSYFNDPEFDNDCLSDDEIKLLVGREIAYQLYEPKSTGLSDKLFEKLKDMLITFAYEHDFSLIDEDIFISVNEVIENYCDSSKDSSIQIHNY